jgi:hypothetical protein
MSTLVPSFRLLTFSLLVSGGFAVMNPDSTLNINAVEGAKLSDLDIEVQTIHPAIWYESS